MPSLVYCEGFEHESASSTGYGVLEKLWNSSAGTPTIDAAGGRLGGSALSLNGDGVTAENVSKTWAGTTGISRAATGTAGARTLVVSGWFKVSSAPSANSVFLMGVCTVNGSLRVNTDGTVSAQIGGASQPETSGANFADGQWHHFDYRFVTTANGFTLDWRIDLQAQTQVTNTSTAADITTVRLGSSSSADVLAVLLDDWVFSATSADYPLGRYAVKALLPTGDGTHVTSGGGGLAKSTGGTTNVWDVLDEFPANTTDYVLQANVATGDYLEVTFADPDAGDTTIDCVVGYAAVFSAGTAANNGTIRIVDSGGTTLRDLWSGDQSDTSLRDQQQMVAQTITNSALQGYKARMGFSSDATPDPQWSAVLLQYATPWSPPVTYGYPFARKERLWVPSSDFDPFALPGAWR